MVYNMYFNCLHLTFVLLTCVANVSMTKNVVLSEQRYDWETAMNERPCAIIKEKTYNRITTDINVIKNVQITNIGNSPTNFEAWTGRYDYYKPEIKFSGSCYRIPFENVEKPKYFYNNVFTDCYKRCQNASFYIADKTMCVCKTNVNTQPKHKCAVKSDNTCLNCGYPIKDNMYCMCLYELKEYLSAYWIPPATTSLEKQCVKVTYNFINRTFLEKEHRCTERLPLLCEETTSQTTLQISDTATRHSSTDKITPPTTSPRTSEAASTKSIYRLTSYTQLSTDRHNTNIRTSSQAEVTFKYVSDRYDEDRTGTTITTAGSNTHQDSNNIPVFAGMGGGIFFIVCLILTISIFMWKKRSNGKRKPKEVELSLDIVRGPDENAYSPIDIKESDDVVDRLGGQIDCLNVSKKDGISNLASKQPASSDNYVYNVLNEVVKPEDVPCGIYDHMSDIQGDVYHTLQGPVPRSVPEEMSDYDVMRGGANHSLGASNTTTVELSDYDTMRNGECHSLNLSNKANIPIVLSDYDTMANITK